MLRRRDPAEDDDVELECPTCGAKVALTQAEAESGKARCPRGHEFAVLGMLGAEPPRERK